jgi:hypothetical protein
MPFTAQEISSYTNAVLDAYLNKGTVHKQNVQNKPMLKAFDAAAGTFAGGKGNISLAIKAGQGGLSLTGYTHDDAVAYGNPATIKRINHAWREHHIGLGLTHTELKIDGITVTEEGADQSTSDKDGREEQALANLLDEKMDDMMEDYAVSMDSLIHGDGTSDAKALAGIQSLILANPTTGSTGGVSRVANTWWRNRAATAAHAGAGGQGAITSATAGGGALLNFLQKDLRQLSRYAQGGTRWRFFAGSDFIDAIEKELRANGNYTLEGFSSEKAVDGGMADIKFKGKAIEYDPSLDNLSLAKRCYVIDMRRVKLWYMAGEKMKRTSPARPYDRYVMYKGITTTAVMAAQQLNTSAVYDIA